MQQIPPGPLNVSTARVLSESVEAVQRLRARLDAMQVDELDWFPVKLTAVDQTGEGPAYSWTEQSYNVTGQLVDNPNGRKGTLLKSPAYEMNGKTIAVSSTEPFYCRLRRRLATLTRNDVYEFDSTSVSAQEFSTLFNTFDYTTKQCIIENIKPGLYIFNYSIWAIAKGGFPVGGFYDPVTGLDSNIIITGAHGFSGYGSPPSQIKLARPFPSGQDPYYGWQFSHWTFYVDASKKVSTFGLRFGTFTVGGPGPYEIAAGQPPIYAVSSGFGLKLG